MRISILGQRNQLAPELAFCLFYLLTNIIKITCQKKAVRRPLLSKIALSDNHLEWLNRLHKSMLVGSYANDSIRNYLKEVRLLFQFHHDKDAEHLNCFG
jgi:hypothetical protein